MEMIRSRSMAAGAHSVRGGLCLQATGCGLRASRSGPSCRLGAQPAACGLKPAVGPRTANLDDVRAVAPPLSFLPSSTSTTTSTT